MSKRVLARQICALLSAYVIALQALLLPLSVAADASFESSLCAAASADISQVPGNRDAGCSCAAGCGVSCCAQALDMPPGIIAPGAKEARSLTTAMAVAPAVRPPTTGPQVPRAPPA
jgi:hypothetical protein